MLAQQCLDAQHYTATLYSNGRVAYQSRGDNLSTMTIHLITQLDDEASYAFGEIKDNWSGDVVHRCRKSAIE